MRRQLRRMQKVRVRVERLQCEERLSPCCYTRIFLILSCPSFLLPIYITCHQTSYRMSFLLLHKVYCTPGYQVQRTE